MKFLTRLRVPLGFGFAGWYFYVARPSSWRHLAYAAIPIVVGCLIRSWAAGYLFKGKRVAVGGPYAYIRNPLYLGSFILGLGFCAVLWRSPVTPMAWALWGTYLLAYGIVYPLKIRAEESELRIALGDNYVRYAARVPRFIPYKGHVNGLGIQHFSSELYARNREYQCILGCLAGLMILAAGFMFGHGHV
jgi:protein-S-isoprenylcysteine O-methyltransferase Ste14